MNSLQIVIIIALAVLIVAVGAWYYLRNRRSQRLRASFGREYDRLVSETGNRTNAERELVERQRRVQKLELHPLSQQERERFTEAWRVEQSKFVDDPKGTVVRADALVIEAMRARGYPMGEFEHRAADISVDHPHMVENYRNAHSIADAARSGQASTEDLRRALVCYRALFEDLLERQVTDREHVVRS